MADTVHIDGSQGEGGGQIVRSSLALSMVTGKPITIENIRAGRKKPGLKRQHLTALNAAAAVCGAEIEGAELGSSAFEFRPQIVQAGEYYFSIGTAGSATLVLQTVLPALMLADGPSSVTIEGGTHNQWAPPFDFLEDAYLPCIHRMGPGVDLSLHRHGFFPKGSGKFTAQILPCDHLRGFDLLERGSLKNRQVEALVANLPTSIASREVRTALRLLRWPAHAGKPREVDSAGPGNVVMIRLEYENVCELITACGRQGTSAEKVAKEAVKEAQAYLDSTAPVGQHLADQLLLPLGISASQGFGGSFRTLELTQHSITHIEVLQQFLEIDVEVRTIEDSDEVTVSLKQSRKATTEESTSKVN